MRLGIKISIMAGTGLLLLLIVVPFAFRNVLLRHYAGERQIRLEERCRLNIRYESLSMKGWCGVQMKGLSVVPEGEDTLLRAATIEVKVNPFKLLFRKLDVRRLDVQDVDLSFHKGDSSSNFNFLYRLTPADTVRADQTTEFITADDPQNGYAGRTDRTLSALFGLLPSDALLREIHVRYQSPTNNIGIVIPELTVTDNLFSADIRTDENGRREQWRAAGELHDSKRKIDARLFAADGGKITLPFLEYKWGARVQFDTLSFGLAETELRNGCLVLGGTAHIGGLEVFHPGLSPEEVRLDQGDFDYRLNIGPDFIELDSTTRIRFNRLAFHPYLRLQKGEQWHLTASVDKPDFPAEDLFASLPKGLFYNLDGLQTEGTLSYHFLLDADFALLDSLKLESELTARNFRILRYGNTDLRKMDTPFIYTAYEKGEPVRSFEIGPTNPNFRPLQAISPLLQMAVMQSEDGAFYYHDGFLIDCIRDALVQDLKEKRFARGGSTISMQLVKNVFLSRTKTIARKLEEALIVWLIETNRLTGKERMYEVYLNIAEWGPRIYGAQEAARYYFNKNADALTLNEAIFMASIIPRPKHVFNSFTEEGHLKPYYDEYFRLIAKRLAAKGLIGETEAENIKAEISFTGPAKTGLTQWLDRKESQIVPEKNSDEEILSGEEMPDEEEDEILRISPEN